MNQVEKEFMEFYSKQFNIPEQLPKHITDQFNIDSCLHSTETKEVYLVTNSQSGKKYIMKQSPKNSSFQSRFERDLLNSISHPSFPKVYSWFEDESYTYIIREYIEGITLEALVTRNGPLDEDKIRGICTQTCDILSYLHNCTPPIIHRDIKPQNIILKTDGEIGIIDFDSSRHYDVYATNDTVYLGTKQTAAPEQFGYGQSDQHTDIYSLGILLIYLATGKYSRSGLTLMTPWLRKIAATCTEFSPKDRYRTVDEVKRRLSSKLRPFLYKKSFAYISVLLLCIIIASTSFLAGKNIGFISEAPKNEDTNKAANIAANEVTNEVTNNANNEVANEVTDKAANKAADKITDKSTNKAADEVTDKAANKAADEVTDKSANKAADEVTYKAVNKVVKEVDDKVTDRTVIPVANEDTKEVTNKDTSKVTDEVTFECEAIEKAVRETLGKKDNDPISKKELAQIAHLTIIGNLPATVKRESIQHDYDGNRIRYNDKEILRGTVDTLVDLKKLPFLSGVTLLYQQLTDLSGIEDLQLQELYVGYNRIKDLTPLKNMKSLTSLSVLCNPVEDLTPLEKLPRLRYIQICATNVTDLTPLSYIDSLDGVDIFGMEMLDQTPLRKKKNLKIYTRN